MRHGWKGRLTGAVVTSLAAAAVAVPMASADIDTMSAWDGTQEFGGFVDRIFTPTVGQTVTGTGETLTGFTVQLDGFETTFQAGVGAWDGSAVSGVLWSGPEQEPDDAAGYEAVSFELSDGVRLSPGQTYVLYVTARSSFSGLAFFGTVDGAAYDGGALVFQTIHGGGNVTDDWNGNWPWADLAFQARFAKAVGVVFVPLPARGGFCTVEGNTDPFTGAKLAPGTFVNLEQAQVTSDPSYAGVVPAIYVEGKGLTCDPPPAGFTQQGLAGDAQQVASGLYPLYAAPKA